MHEIHHSVSKPGCVKDSFCPDSKDNWGKLKRESLRTAYLSKLIEGVNFYKIKILPSSTSDMDDA